MTEEQKRDPVLEEIARLRDKNEWEEDEWEEGTWDSVHRDIALLIIANQALNESRVKLTTAYAEAALLLALGALGVTMTAQTTVDSLVLFAFGMLLCTISAIGLLLLAYFYGKGIIKGGK
jgi:hypothetical protein